MATYTIPVAARVTAAATDTAKIKYRSAKKVLSNIKSSANSPMSGTVAKAETISTTIEMLMALRRGLRDIYMTVAFMAYLLTASCKKLGIKTSIPTRFAQGISAEILKRISA